MCDIAYGIAIVVIIKCNKSQLLNISWSKYPIQICLSNRMQFTEEVETLRYIV